MIFKLSARVEGDLVLDTPYSISFGDCIIDFIVQDQKLTAVSAGKRVPVEAFSAQLEPAGDGGIPTLRITADHRVTRELLQTLRTIESNLGFLAEGAFNGLRLDEITEERIAESDEEEPFVQMTSFKRSARYPRVRGALSKESLDEFVKRLDKEPELVEPKAFLLEGDREFERFRYIQAFCHRRAIRGVAPRFGHRSRRTRFRVTRIEGS